MNLVQRRRTVLVAALSGSGRTHNSITDLWGQLGDLNGDPRHPFTYARLIATALRPVDYARNYITETFLQDRYDLLWQIDEDMGIPTNWQHLFSHYGKSAVSGLAFGWESGAQGIRTPKPMQVLYNQDANGKFQTAEITPGGQPFEVDAVGAACLLLRRDLVEKIPHENGEWWKHKYGYMGAIEEGEDQAFFRKANALGYRVTVDPAVMVGHEKEADTMDIARYGIEVRRRALKEAAHAEVQVAQAGVR